MLYCISICMSPKSLSQIFKILFQNGDINNFVPRGVFFSRYSQLKSSFSDEKNISGEIWDTFYYRSYQSLTWLSIKKNCIIGSSRSFAKLFIMQKCTHNPNGDVPSAGENVIFLISFEIKVRTCSFGKKKKSYLINRFLYKKYFY